MGMKGMQQYRLWWTLVTASILFVTPAKAAAINLAWMGVSQFTYFFNASTALGALAYSVDEIENDGSLLPGDTFDIRWKDSGCNSKAAVGAMFDYLLDASWIPDLFLGPICSGAMAPVAQLASYLNKPVFGWISSDPPLADKELYSTLVRFLWDINNIGEGVAIVCRQAGWERVSIISTVGNDYGVLAEGVQTVLQQGSDPISVQRWYSGVVVTPDQETILAAYDAVKDESRIVILVCPFDELRNWTIGAYDSEMAGGDYVIIYVTQQTPEEDLVNYLTSSSFWRIGDERDQDVREIYQNFILVFAKTLPFAHTNQLLDDFYTAAQSMVSPPVPAAVPDFYSLFLYDAMKVYARFATSTGSVNDGHVIFDAASNSLTADGATGDIILSDTCDRIPDYWFFDMTPDDKFAIAAQTVTTKSGSTISRSIEIVEDFHWADGSVGLENAPPDTPPCGFDGEDCEDLLIYWLPPVIIVLVIIIVIIIVFVYRKLKYEQELNSLLWKLNYEEMSLYMGAKAPGSQLNLRAVSTTLHKSKASVGDSLAGEQLFITVANYKGLIVAIRKVRKPQGIKLERNLLQEMRRMQEVKHNNLNTFIGACIDPTKEVCCVWEYCTKGSLQDVIYNDSIGLDDMFKFSISMDTLRGLVYLHESSLKVHGKLKSSNLVIDGRWTCKLTDYGMEVFCEGEEKDEELSEHAKYSGMFWSAPETLDACSNSGDVETLSDSGDVETLSDTCRCQTTTGDIYSVGVILKEIFCRNAPYHENEDDHSPKEIIAKVMQPTKGEVFRPELKELESAMEMKGKVPQDLSQLIGQCWAEESQDRPTASQALKALSKINPFKKSNVVDNMMKMMEKYTKQLEEIVSGRTQELQEEQKKTEGLLFKMLPVSVAEDLKHGKSVDAESYDCVTIFFSDIPGFSALAAECTPLQVIDILNGIYSLMDETINTHDVYKVETVGDVYVLVSGLPIRNGDRHIVEVVNCALDLISRILTFKVPHKPHHKLPLRIGVNTGPIVTGVVGLTNPRYCLFGDTMNTASRMESNSKALRIHLSATSFAALNKFSGFHLADRGEIPVKGKGMMNTYWLVGKTNYECPLPDYRSELSLDSPAPTFMPPTVGKTSQPKVLRPSMESGFSEMTTADSRKTSTNSNQPPMTSGDNPVTSSGGVLTHTDSGNHLIIPDDNRPLPTSGGLPVVDSTSAA